jgi:hypothetical protein
MIGYTYGLFNGDGKQVDQTSIDEKDEKLAMELFKEFEKDLDYTITEEYYVELIDIEEDDGKRW